MSMLKRVVELGDTTSSEVRGPAYSGYTLLPAVWLKEIIDGAKKRHYGAQFAYQTELQPGQKDVVIPRVTHYIGSGTSWAAYAGEGAAVSYTTMNTLCGVTLSPAEENYGIALSNSAIRTNAVDLVRHARDQLTYAAGDAVDRSVFAALNSLGDASSSTARGAQRVMGGDATQASELAAGDVITTDMVAEAKRKMQSSSCTYWTNGTGEAGNSAENKNPWVNETNAPFVLFIAPEQEETFLTDSQFVNASEYGNRDVISNGEIGSYLGIKIVVTDNVPSYAASTTHRDATTTAVQQHVCIMAKGKKSVAIAYGLKPKLHVVDYASQLEQRLILEQAYKADVVQNDAIVWIDVADK